MIYDPRIPERDLCVLGYQIERWALQKPVEIAIMFYGGETWTWRQTGDTSMIYDPRITVRDETEVKPKNTKIRDSYQFLRLYFR